MVSFCSLPVEQLETLQLEGSRPDGKKQAEGSMMSLSQSNSYHLLPLACAKILYIGTPEASEGITHVLAQCKVGDSHGDALSTL